MKRLTLWHLPQKIRFSVLISFVCGTIYSQVPVITSFTPESGPVGTTITITGTNFSTTPSDNIVWFGAVKGLVYTASATELTVRVPAGTTFQPLTVTVNGSTAYSAKPFIVTFLSRQVIDPAAFASKIDFPVGMNPFSSVVNDLDSDGRPDLAITSEGSNFISLFRNISSPGSFFSGSFAPRIDLTAGPNPKHIAAGDIDGDGISDLVVTNAGGNTVSVFRNTSSPGTMSLGTFAPKVDFETGTSPFAVYINDIDRDGKPDLVVTNYTDGTISVLRNTSTKGTIDAGSFAARVDFTTGVNPYFASVGDIDGDGKPDITVANFNSATVSIFRNTSLPGIIQSDSFAARVDLPTGTGTICTELADIDGDGKSDLAVLNNHSSTLSLFKNISTTGIIDAGSFASRVDFTTGAYPYQISAGDIDGDGKPDLAVVNSSINKVSIFKNNCTTGLISIGSLTSGFEFSTWTFPFTSNISDIDCDGMPDIIVVNGYSNVISVLRNTMPLPLTPVITSVVPASGPAGTNVTITGMNFNILAEKNSVWFGAVKAIVSNATETELTVIVPVGATYNPITVTTNGLTAYSGVPFKLTFPSTNKIETTTLDPKVDLNSGTVPDGITLGDIDVDGKPDLIVANSQDNTFSVYKNISTAGSLSTGSFSDRVDFATATLPHGVALGDLDGDGKPDLVVANFNSNSISVYRNTSMPGSISTGSFASKVDLAAGVHPENVAIGDIDGDGRPDLAVTNNGDDVVSIFRNIGTTGSITTGSFASRIDFTTGAGSGPWGIVFRDIDGDGKSDISVSNNTSNQICIFRNTSTTGIINSSSFALPVYIPAVNPMDIAIGDIDGDGKPDLVVTNVNSNSVSIFRNTSIYGIITFADNIDFAAGINPYCIALGDIDGNGKPDMAVSNNSGGSVSIYRNTSTPGSITAASIAEKVDFSCGLAPYGIVLGDVDGDNRPDIIVSNSGGNNISVLRNALQAPVPPVIDSFTPASGAVGAAVTINGSGFSTTLSDNFVWFGSVKATVTSATTSQLSVTVPAGAAYHPITVTVNGMTASSGSQFIPAFAGTSEITTSAFSYKIDLTVGMFPSSFAAGDIDEDGKPDLFVTNTNSNSISAFRNTNTAGSISSGMFGPRVDIASGMNPQGIVTADIDGDGKLDLVVANGTTSSSVSVYRNNGTTGSVTGGSFDPRVDLPTGDSSIDVAVGDIDGDGRPDLVITNYNSTFISIYRNTSTPGSITAGSFAPVVNFPAEQFLQHIVLADIDGDRKPDLVVPSISGSAVSVYRNISTTGSITTGSFSSKVDFITGMDPVGVAVGDLDGDGKPEIVVANGMESDLSVLHNISTPGTITAGSFEPKTDFNTGGIRYVTIGDINGDAKLDLVYKNNENKVNVLKNNCTTGSIGPGSFASAVEFEADHGAAKTLLADFDCDGKPDIAYLYNGAVSSVSILRNKTAEYPPPVITSFTPVQGPVGTTVTISGSNFSTIPADNTVFFGTIQAAVLAATATQLTVAVPAGAASSIISVTVYGQTANSESSFTVSEPVPPPVITSFNPAFGQTHWTLFITGNNFSPIPANNIVWFGAVRAQVNAATTSELTVIVPAGATYKPITVTVNGLTAYSRMPYNNVFPGLRNIDASTLSQRVDFPAPGSDFTEISDLDGDGKPDLILSNSGSISIFRNTSSYSSFHAGSLDTRVDLNSGGNATGISIGDIDGDGRPDIVFANHSNNTVSIFRNISAPGSITTGSFDARVDIPVGIRPEDVAIGDLDGDGRPDLAVVNYGDGNSVATSTVSILKNTGSPGFISSGSFAGKVDFQAGFGPIKVAINDLDGDGKPDIIFSKFQGGAISVLRNTSTTGAITSASFAARVDISVGDVPYAFDTGDLDGDGKPDLVVVKSLSEETTVSVLRNVGSSGSIANASFASKVDFTTGPNPKDVVIGDIDGDGRPDIVVANQNWNTISVFKNKSSSGSITANSFALKVDFTSGSGPGGLAVGDLDADGKPEIVVRSFYDGIISVFRNSTITPNPPVISGINTDSGPVGSSVIIAGGNFSQNPEENIVMFGDVQATVTGASQDQLTVLVPSGADGQSVSVTVFGQTAYLDISFTVTATQEIELESAILTLNGDGINEVFRVKNFESYGESKLRVYNSRAALVYWNDDFQGEWDVTLHNMRFETGGYFYVIETSIGTFRGSFSILK